MQLEPIEFNESALVVSAAYNQVQKEHKIGMDFLYEAFQVQARAGDCDRGLYYKISSETFKVSVVAKKQGTRAMSNLRILGEKIKTLEAEKCNLLLEIEGFKKLAKSKANDLESEVKVLREEVESFKTLLGLK